MERESKRQRLDVDTVGNHYTSIDDTTPSSRFKDKVTFIDVNSEHKYILSDEKGSYSDLIISGSRIYTYWKEWNRPYNGNISDKLHHVMHACASGFRMSTKYYLDTPKNIKYQFEEHFNRFQGLQPMTYASRRDSLLSIYAKDYTYFVPSHIFELIERYLISRNAEDLNGFSADDDACNLLCWLGGAEDPTFSNINDTTLREKFCSVAKVCDDRLVERTAQHVVDHYSIPNMSGRKLHSYLELRLGDPIKNTAESTKEVICGLEREDYNQCDEFVAYIQDTGIVFKSLECRLGSFRHRLCGSADAIECMEDGTLRIWDWKRVGKWLDDSWFNVPKQILQIVNTQHTLSSDLVRYMFQLAIYRKLCLLQSTDDKPVSVSDDAMLTVFHPARQTWVILAIDLSAPLKPDTRSCIPAFGKGPFSPIQYVDMIFDEREKHLKEYEKFVAAEALRTTG